jgi:hypothetical protein
MLDCWCIVQHQLYQLKAVAADMLLQFLSELSGMFMGYFLLLIS